MIVLTEAQVNDLCIFVEKRLEKKGCDHSLKHTFKWAKIHGVNRDDLIDVLEENGGSCDCEVIMNLPEDCDLKLEQNQPESDVGNPFKIPLKYEIAENRAYTKAIFSSSAYEYHNYTNEGELLIPAPYGYKPKGRIRKSSHFFTGIETELPTELGFVQEIEPTTAKAFANMVRDSKLKSLERFTEREADYYLSKVDKVALNKPMATNFTTITGIGGPKIELRIHKVIFRK